MVTSVLLSFIFSASLSSLLKMSSWNTHQHHFFNYYSLPFDPFLVLTSSSSSLTHFLLPSFPFVNSHNNASFTSSFLDFVCEIQKRENNRYIMNVKESNDDHDKSWNIIFHVIISLLLLFHFVLSSKWCWWQRFPPSFCLHLWSKK